MSDAPRTSTAAWLGSLGHSASAASTLNAKFSTIALGNSQAAARQSRTGLGFFEDAFGAAGPAMFEDHEARQLAPAHEQDAWSITLAEGPKARSRSRKPDPSITVYISTPTSSLTLTRKLSEVLDFEAQLQAEYPGIVSARPLVQAQAPPTHTTKRRNVLASLSRTLSPRRTSQGSSSSSRGGLTSIVLGDLASRLSKASTYSAVRSGSVWRSFFVVRRDDLESARIERRIKRARSDQTMHIETHQPVVEPQRHDLSSILEPVSGRRGGGEARNGDARMARQEFPAMSGSTEEVMDTPSLLGRPSYFFDQTDDKEGSLVQAIQPESTRIVPSGVVTTELSLKPDDISQVPQDTSTAATADLKASEADQEPLEEPKSSHFLSPSSSTVATSPSSRMTRSLSRTSGISIEKRSKGVTIDAFEIKRVLGKGCAGKVLLVKLKGSDKHFALKAITKRHVLAHRELEHTRTEQSVLKTCGRDKSNPFVVQLHYSFHDRDTLYLALDFHPGGDLATQLARWGRLGRDRARFYTAEMVEGIEGLHRAGIIYRDLKPENVLISAEGHIVLTDFGLSKDFHHSRVLPPTATLKDELPQPHWLSAHPGQRAASTPPATIASFTKRETATTFCGTAEYLAPEVLLGEPYSYEVDAWSLGTMLYEMLAGITPFYAEQHSAMYQKVISDELTFEEEDDYPVFEADTKSFIRGMLQKDPLLRMTDSRIKAHPYFSMIDWSHVYHRRYVPPFVPKLNPQDPTDTSQFDDCFLSMTPQVEAEPGERVEDDPPQGQPQAAFDDSGKDVFDGYSYYGRDSDSIQRFEVEDDEEDSDEPMQTDLVDATIQKRDQSRLEGQVRSDNLGGVKVDSSEGDPGSLRTDTSTQVDLDQSSSMQYSGLSDSDNTLSSIITASTQPTTVAADSPATSCRRHSSSLSNLEPVTEVAITPLSPEIVLEESEEQTDSEWDLLDGKECSGVSRNGGRGATLFAKGFRDKYRLAVAMPLRSPPARRMHDSRKGSSSSGRSSLSASPEPPRSPSGILRFTTVRHRSKASRRSLSSQQPSPVLDPLPSSASLSTLSIPVSLRPTSSDGSTSKKTSMSSSSFSATNLAGLVETNRRAGASIKNFAKSTFLPKNSQ
ncbi:AGC family serine/threonine-protein kinase [Sporobolomyces koalae]|uniref:AGC family serine/threonine-protein kinase n=1 Tax=Sporobolomyces koalae TaxID=500713 RepID=UPI0031758129